MKILLMNSKSTGDNRDITYGPVMLHVDMVLDVGSDEIKIVKNRMGAPDTTQIPAVLEFNVSEDIDVKTIRRITETGRLVHSLEDTKKLELPPETEEM